MDVNLPVIPKISHESYLELARLRDLTVTPERFKQLVPVPLELLDDTAARKLITHLRVLEPYAALYRNIVIARLETNQNKPFLQPVEVAADVVPHLMDIRSKETWIP